MSQHNVQQVFRDTMASLAIARFMHYRDFLGQLYAAVKLEVRPYSYVKFAQDLGFGDNNNFLRLIIKGQRSLTLKSGRRIADALGMGANETKYWMALIEFCNAKRPGAIESATARMQALKTRLLPDTVDAARLSYFTEWHHSVIRELAGRPDFRVDPRWVQDQLAFPLNLNEIKRSLELLTKLGLIYYDAAQARYVRSEEQIDTGPDARGIAYIRYHEKMIEQAKKAISRVTKQRREIIGATMLLSEEGMESLRVRLREFLDEAMLLEDVNKHVASEVVQLNLQVFPFTSENKT